MTMFKKMLLLAAVATSSVVLGPSSARADDACITICNRAFWEFSRYATRVQASCVSGCDPSDIHCNQNCQAEYDAMVSGAQIEWDACRAECRGP